MKAVLKKNLRVIFSIAMSFVLLTGMSTKVNAEEPTATEFKPPKTWEGVETYVTPSDFPHFNSVRSEEAATWTGAPAGKLSFLFFKYDNDSWNYAVCSDGRTIPVVEPIKLSKDAIWNASKNSGIYYTSYTPASASSSGSAPRHVQDQTLITGYIVNGKDANGNDTYATFSQDNVWSVTKVASSENSVTYDIYTQWETYGTVHVGIPALGFTDGPVLVDQYRDDKLIGTYEGWVTWEYCDFDNPGGFGSTFVIRKA